MAIVHLTLHLRSRPLVPLSLKHPPLKVKVVKENEEDGNAFNEPLGVAHQRKTVQSRNDEPVQPHTANAHQHTEHKSTPQAPVELENEIPLHKKIKHHAAPVGNQGCRSRRQKTIYQEQVDAAIDPRRDRAGNRKGNFLPNKFPQLIHCPLRFGEPPQNRRVLPANRASGGTPQYRHCAASRTVNPFR